MYDTKKKLNITGRCYVKENNADGEILSFLIDVPMKADTADLLFILTVPGIEQKYAPAYCRLQDKSKMREVSTVRYNDLEDLEEIRTVGYIKETKKGYIIVCAPQEHKKVELDKVVVIATIPAEGKFTAPCYIRRKVFEKTRNELREKTGEVVMEVEEDSYEFDMKTADEKQHLVNAGLII